MDTTIKDVTPVRLATWLAACADNAVVGKTCASSSCPLATCLMALNDTDWACVRGSTHSIGVGYGSMRHLDNKPWQRRFVGAIDALHGRVMQSPVTAQQARIALLMATEGMREQVRVREILTQK